MSSAPNGCLSLSSSQACPMFATSSVGLGLQGQQIPFNDTATFDSWFTSFYGTQAGFATTAKATQKCDSSSTYNAANQRYIRSVECFLLVDAAKENGCISTQSTTIPLCKSVMETFLTEYSRVFSASSPACTVTAPPTQNPLTVFNILNTKAANDSNCIAGLDAEIRLCGFYTAAAARVYCTAIPNDPCCKSTAIGGSVSDSSKLLPLLISPNTTLSPPPATPVASNTSPTSFFSTGIIIGIAFAAFIGLLSLILIAGLINKRKKIKIPNHYAQDYQPTYSSSNPFIKQSPIITKQSSSSPLTKAENMAPHASLAAEVEMMQVLFSYVPNLQDEIHLYTGDAVIIKARFDDGWGLGLNMNTKQEGSFPLACVGPFNGGGKGFGNPTLSSRHSSLYLPSEAGNSIYKKYDSTYQN